MKTSIIISIHNNCSENENMEISAGNVCILGNFIISQKDHCIAGSPHTPLADSHFTRATYIRNH